jgi:Gpi18-like mannosyltransferase
MREVLSIISNLIKKYQFQIFLSLGLRIGYSLWLAIVWFVIDKYIPVSEGVLWETYYNLARSPTLLGRAFIDVWLRWDAVHYMNIAAFGYEGVGVADTVFFPLYPYLVGVLSRLTTVNVTLIAILTSSIAILFALIFLYELVLALFHDKRLARWSTVCIALYPTAFFLHAPYTDALFLSVSIGSILMMVKRQPLVAGLLVCIAGLTRAQGVLLMLPMVLYYIQDHWKERTFLNWQEVLSLVISPLGFGIYSFIRMKYGISGFFTTYEIYSATGFRFPHENILYAIQELIQSPTLLEFSEFISVILFLILLIWMFFQNQFRKHLPLMLYSAAIWLLITSKTVFYASPLQSANRYVLHIFFAFVGLTSLILNLSWQKQKLILFLSLAVSVVLAAMYALWVFIG